MPKRIGDLDSWTRKKIKRRLLAKYGPYCQICLLFNKSKSQAFIDLALEQNSDYGWSVDHIIPASKGGTNSQKNLQPSHRKCNSQRQDKPLAVLLAVSCA